MSSTQYIYIAQDEDELIFWKYCSDGNNLHKRLITFWVWFNICCKKGFYNGMIS